MSVATTVIWGADVEDLLAAFGGPAHDDLVPAAGAVAVAGVGIGVLLASAAGRPWGAATGGVWG